MMKHMLKTFALPGIVLGIGLFGAPVFGADMPRPGTVNYVEGSAYLQGKPLNPHDVGSVEMAPGQTLRTGQGRAEILLTPGVFLRVDDHSTVKMISPDITPTQVELDRGRAAIEVDQLFKQNDIEITDGGVPTHLAKDGYYEFDANPATAVVFKGEAVVDHGDGRYQNLKAHHEMALVENEKAKSVNFNVTDAENGLYKWSSLRSQYLAEANNQIAGEYAGAPGFYPGWYWDPYMWDYTFIGGGPFWSPFGFGFYPPWYGGFYGGGFYGGRVFYGGGFHGGGFHGGGGFRGGGGHR
jgi:hypothetical protein